MGCCSGFARCILIILNVVFIVCGLGILGASGALVGILLGGNAAWLEYLNKALNELDKIPGLKDSGVISADFLLNLGYFGIALGCVIFIIAVLGCCGACNENRCCLFTYIILVGVIFVASLSGVIAVFVLKGKVVTWLKEEMSKGMIKEYYHPKADEDKPSADWYLAWSMVEYNLGCCGASSPKDYTSTESKWYKTYYQTQGNYLPTSCEKGLLKKKTPPKADSPDNISVGNANEKGCVDTIADYINEYAPIFGGAVGGVCALELVVIIMASCIACRSRDDDKY